METDLHHVIESLKLRKNGIRGVNYELNDGNKESRVDGLTLRFSKRS